jgi:hypothetical protein
MLLVIIAVLTVGELAELYNGSRQIFRGEEASELLLRAEWRQLGQLLMKDAAPGDFLVYGGDGPRRPPRFLAPYESSEFASRVHSLDPRTLTQATIWWIGIQPDPSEIDDFANGAATTHYDFDQVQAARITRPTQFAEVDLSNPGFESAGSADGGDNGVPHGWTLIKSNKKEKGIAFALDLNHAAGATSLRATYAAGNDAELDSSEFAVVSGQLFRATVLVRDVTTGFYTESPGLNIEFLDANGKTIFDPLEPVLLPSSRGADWQLEVVDGAVPDGAVTAHVALQFKDFARPYHAVTWVDDVHVYLENVAK